MKYTKEQDDEMYSKYKAAEDADARSLVVVTLAKKWDKPTRSIIAKLSKMGIYISKANISKVTGNKPETKEQIVTRIEKKWNVLEGTFIGLEKAPKLVLITLLSTDIK